MQRQAYFDSYDTYASEGWPSLEFLKPYFIAPKGQEWFYSEGNDSAGLTIKGLQGTEQATLRKDRIDVRLSMWGNPEHGVLLIYEKVGGGYREAFSSKGDMSRIREWVRTLHGDLMPIGLYIPFAEAWKAVKEFMETNGELPKSIEWVPNKALPEKTFPDPFEVVLAGEKPAHYLSPQEAAAAIARGQGKL